ncbi:sigma-70 family RNA polymerase sigma factor [Altericista sp. CCNU0014]|uniref:sigma-70 family RNA polymerase sigma factor n=1 Tax=Altericista sp. CCNU0014 TaxID=3082949 RepID=UPI00384B24A5
MEPLPVVDDASLLTRIAKGDQTALSALYDRYARIIHSVAFKSLRSIEESEEVVLDVFAQVWRIAGRYDKQKGRADTWLFMLARSRVLDRLRKLQRNRASAPAFNDADEIQIPASEVSPIEEAMISERRDRVASALKNLPDEQRLAIELAYYQGLTQSQIAAQTGLSLGTVKTRVRLGLSKLKLTLEAETS